MTGKPDASDKGASARAMHGELARAHCDPCAGWHSLLTHSNSRAAAYCVRACAWCRFSVLGTKRRKAARAGHAPARVASRDEAERSASASDATSSDERPAPAKRAAKRPLTGGLLAASSTVPADAPTSWQGLTEDVVIKLQKRRGHPKKCVWVRELCRHIEQLENKLERNRYEIRVAAIQSRQQRAFLRALAPVLPAVPAATDTARLVEFWLALVTKRIARRLHVGTGRQLAYALSRLHALVRLPAYGDGHGDATVQHGRELVQLACALARRDHRHMHAADGLSPHVQAFVDACLADLLDEALADTSCDLLAPKTWRADVFEASVPARAWSARETRVHPELLRCAIVHVAMLSVPLHQRLISSLAAFALAVAQACARAHAKLSGPMPFPHIAQNGASAGSIYQLARPSWLALGALAMCQDLIVLAAAHQRRGKNMPENMPDGGLLPALASLASTLRATGQAMPGSAEASRTRMLAGAALHVEEAWWHTVA